MSRALVNCIPENYFVHIIPSIYGSVSATPNSGNAYTLVELNNTPIEGSVFRGYDISGATLFDDNKFKFHKNDVYVKGNFSHNEYITLWETNAPFNNLYSISLSDSINNYDEFIVYGSAIRCDINVATENKYIVNKTGVSQCSVNFAGNLDDVNSFYVVNGTDLWISGTSGYISSSYYMGENNNATMWCAELRNNNSLDVHPYKIVGIKEV